MVALGSLFQGFLVKKGSSAALPVPPSRQRSLKREGWQPLTFQEESLGHQQRKLQAVEGWDVVEDDGPEIHRSKTCPNPARHGC